MSRALTFTLLALAVVVVAFVATWFTIPNGLADVKVGSVDYPAKLFRYGLEKPLRTCVDERIEPSRIGPGRVVCARSAVTSHLVDPEAMKSRAAVFYGGLAAVIVLVGAAFGAFRRKPSGSQPVESRPA